MNVHCTFSTILIVAQIFSGDISDIPACLEELIQKSSLPVRRCSVMISMVYCTVDGRQRRASGGSVLQQSSGAPDGGGTGGQGPQIRKPTQW